MASTLLTPALRALDAEIDRHAPDRDHRSDGDIGDAAHRGTVSDHNPDESGRVPIHDADTRDEVHALDVDASGPWPWAGGMAALVRHIVARCRAGTERRLRYIIFDRVIYSASNGWNPRPYTGANPHTEHAHFSGSYDSAREADTGSWHLEDIPIMINDADVAKIIKALDTAPIRNGRTLGGTLNALAEMTHEVRSIILAIEIVSIEPEADPDVIADGLTVVLGDRSEAVARAILAKVVGSASPSE